MDCIPLDLTANTSLRQGWLVAADSNLTASDVTRQPITRPYEASRDFLLVVEMALYTKVAAVICVAGLVGNALNMAVLTRRRLQAGMTSMERTVYLGLAALALSDMLFCACALPHAWVPPRMFYFRRRGFALYYSLYSDALINVFVMCSTWLTVAMATSRYVAICHPLRARCLISGCRAKISIAAIFLFCIFCNLPRFWNEAADSMPCAGGWTAYFRSAGAFRGVAALQTAYMCTYFVLASVVPFVLLVFCNSRLIFALRQSLGLREPGHVVPGGQADTHRTSLTLILIVVMYIVLVLPAELTHFLRLVVISTPAYTAAFNVALAALNVMQASNFAFHFFLYCIVNVHFRHSMRAAFACDQQRRARTIALNDCEQAMALTNGETTGATIM